MKRPVNRNRVIVLGDSVTYGSSIQLTEQTIPGRLDAYLPEMDVANFGINGYCTLGQVALLEARGPQLKPDVVIVLFVENDYDDLNSEIRPVQQRSLNRHIGTL